MTRHQFLYVLKNRARCWDVVQLQVGVQGDVIQFFFNSVSQNRFHLGSEDKFVFIKEIKQRLHAITITSDEKGLFFTVVNTKRKEAIELVEAFLLVKDK